MAGVSTKEIKNRIRSMQSTRQITKAMEMVAASKLRRAQAQILNSRPYFEILQSTIADIISADLGTESAYLQKRTGGKTAVVVIAGDRGLAGGYNNNVLKLAHSQLKEGDCVLPVGKKALEYFSGKGFPLLSEGYCDAESISIGECFSAAKLLCKGYLAGEFDRIALCYTDFDSVLSQTPRTTVLLPLTPENTEKTPSDILYEPDGETVLGAIVPEYLGGVLYGALCESRASEQAARRTAMDSATSNADDMIADLSLKFNRARQAAITQEITEIVAGS